MKELVIFDVDGTIIKGQSQQLFLNFLYKKGYVSIFYYIRIMIWFVFYKLGLVKNPLSAMKYAFVFAKGKKVSDLDFIVDDFFNHVLKEKIYPESMKIIKGHHTQGRTVLLVSNAADILIKRISTYLDIYEFLSTRLEVVNGIYTGNIVGDIMYGENKLEAVKKYLQLKGLSLDNSWSYGDHFSDIPLLSQTTHPYAVNPTKELKKIAVEKNWPILNFKL